MAQPCSDSFAVNVNGGEIPCQVRIPSDEKTHDLDVEDVLAGGTVDFEFTYAVGKPKRTVFASSYTKGSAGRASGTAPDLGTRSFSRQPDETADPRDVTNTATFSVDIPAYSAHEAALGDGTDTYNITLWMREANVRIGGTSPPPNLEPANPA